MFGYRSLGFGAFPNRDVAFNIANSALFNDNDSDYMQRTSKASNQRRWTLAFWFKFGSVTGRQMFLAQDEAYIDINENSSTSALINIYLTGVSPVWYWETDAMLRDPHAWYHITIAFDSEHATANSRLRVYINGVEETSFTKHTTGNQNSAPDIGGPSAMVIGGGTSGTPAGFFDGYLAQYTYVNGQQLTPLSFGEFDSNGVWKPKEIDTATLFPGVVTNDSTNFDGSNDYLTRGGAMTGLSDGTACTFSCFVRKTGGDGSAQRIFIDNAGHINFSIESSNKVEIALHNASASELSDSHSSNTITADGVWHHIMFSSNTSTDAHNLYVDGVNVLDKQNSTTGTVDFTQTDYAVGAATNGSNKFHGDIAELYFTNEFIDLSDADNRLKFLTATGTPANLGADGSTPTGTQPILYLANPFGTFQNNLGSGGNFTENGALTQGAKIDPIYSNGFFLPFTETNLGADTSAQTTAATLSFVGFTASGSSSSTLEDYTSNTYSSISIGSNEAAGRIILIAAVTTGGGSGTDGISSMTCGGIAGVKVFENLGTDHQQIAVFLFRIPTGTTADVVVTYQRSTKRGGIYVYEATGISHRPNTFVSTLSSSSAAITSDFDVQAGSVAMAITVHVNGEDRHTLTHTNLTEDNDVGLGPDAGSPSGSGTQTGSGSATFSNAVAAQTLTVTPNGTVPLRSTAFLVFGPENANNFQPK